MGALDRRWDSWAAAWGLLADQPLAPNRVVYVLCAALPPM